MAKRLNGTIQAYFLWDGDNLLAELNSGANAVVTEYSYYGADQPQAVIKQPAKQKYFPRLDGLGNVIALTDTTSTIKRDYLWDDWGKSTGGTDNAGFGGTDRARWKGALWMGSEVDLYYMRNRWYEPHSGRFLSEDPIGLSGGINPVTFAGNDPVNRSDPSGLCELGDNYIGWKDESGRFVSMYCWPSSPAYDGTTNPGRRPRSGGPGAVDCKRVKCPPVRRIKDAVEQFGLDLLKACNADPDGNERGAFIFNGAAGTVVVGPTYIGIPDQVPQMLNAPDDAIASIHCHPDLHGAHGWVAPGNTPSDEDFTNVKRWKIHGLVITSPRWYLQSVADSGRWSVSRRRP